MEIKSLSFLLFVLVTVILYYSFSKFQRIQRMIILLANVYLIVAFTGKRSLLMILFLASFVYGWGIWIEKQVKNKKKNAAKALMWIGVLLVIANLCYFKFFKDTYVILQNLLSAKGLQINDLLTPVGISYYSLSCVAYLLDVYHKKHEAEKNYWNFIVFITYFPAIIQGPIGLYKTIGNQFKQQHFPEYNRIVMGLQRILWGYIKKIVIADRIGVMVMGILTQDTSEGVLIFWAMVLYSFQIYADFSGGIDVVMGISEILDIQLTENFKAPLISQSITEYWQRWHMSLGAFMEKYIYYPLVLDRKMMKLSKRIQNKYLQKVFSATIASIVVFVIVGIWHGTGWNYVVYGCYQALFVASAVLLGPVYKKGRELMAIDQQSISYKILTVLRTFLILVFGRIFIKAKDLPQAIELFHKIFKNWNPETLFDGTLMKFGLDYKNVYLMYLGIFLLILVDILHENGYKLRETLMKQDIIFRYAVYIVGLFGIIIFGIYGPEFSAATFIYQNF